MKYSNQNHLEILIETLKENLNTIEINSTAIWSNTGWTIGGGAWDNFEIYYVIEGSVQIKYENSIKTIYSEEVFFVDNAVFNQCEDGKFTIFGFNFGIVQNKASSLALYKMLQNCYSNLSQEKYKVGKNLIVNYLTEITKEYIMKQVQFDLNIKMLVLQVLVKALRTINSENKGNVCYKSLKYTDTVSKIILFLSENLHCSISLDEIEKTHHLSKRYLDQIFKYVTGYPIIKYLQLLKVERAKKLLVSSTLSILEIALDLNFGSSQYLSYIFKKETGFSPGEYRKMNRMR